jgi:hypothetical protein
MGISYSPDLEFWVSSSQIPIPKTNWQLKKSGSGAIPIKTLAGRLEIYHGTSMTAYIENDFLRAVLLDHSKIIAAPRDRIFFALTPYECVGQVPCRLHRRRGENARWSSAGLFRRCRRAHVRRGVDRGANASVVDDK